MARPERNNVNYFPFICEEGKKMYYIEETYGNDGFATFVKLLRELARAENHFLDLSKPTTLMFLSAKCKVSKSVLESIIKDLVDLGKFDQVLWDENRVIWCQDFIDNIQDAYLKRKNKCITYDGLLLLLVSLGIRKHSKSKLPVPDNTHIIKDNKILKNKIEEYEERKLKFASTLEPFLEQYGKEFLNEFYRYWTEPNNSHTRFKRELEKTWDLERRLETWSKNEKNFKKKTDAKTVATNKKVIGRMDEQTVNDNLQNWE